MQAIGANLRLCLCLGALVLPLIWAGGATAQFTERDFEQTGEPNETYLDATSGQGLQTEILYLKPDAGFKPDENVRIEVPKAPEEQRASVSSIRWTWGIILGIVLAFILWVIVTQGGAIGVSFGSTSKRDGRRGEEDEGPTDDELEAINRQPLDQFLASLLAMKDRRQALILLVSRALERAADTNNVRLGRAQTARDVVRLLPRNWTHFGTIRGLVREAEIVHFGGRDLSEEKWEECFAAAKPIFQRGRAA